MSSSAVRCYSRSAVNSVHLNSTRGSDMAHCASGMLERLRSQCNCRQQRPRRRFVGSDLKSWTFVAVPIYRGASLWTIGGPTKIQPNPVILGQRTRAPLTSTAGHLSLPGKVRHVICPVSRCSAVKRKHSPPVHSTPRHAKLRSSARAGELR